MKPEQILERINKHNDWVKLAVLCVLLKELGMEAYFTKTKKNEMKK